MRNPPDGGLPPPSHPSAAEDDRAERQALRTPARERPQGESSALASYLALVDTANGVAVQQDPTAWMFPNLDLTIHLHRQPRGPWTGLDTTVTFGPSGQGLTSSVLHDLDGPVGHAEQILTVRPLS
ncbi:thioesterase family protein [Streptomyces yangpuensis]|uniref:hypothetical protein n=1 Tax=Streptomyces yangpuensis TaxID=1648182 RepID=UPI00366151D2